MSCDYEVCMHRKFILIILLFCFSVLIIACSGDSSESSETNILYNQLLIDNDDFFMNSHWNDPHVLYTGGQFVMYASSDSIVSNWDGFVRIFRFVSDDGKNWSITNGGDPVLALGGSGD